MKLSEREEAYVKGVKDSVKEELAVGNGKLQRKSLVIQPRSQPTRP